MQGGFSQNSVPSIDKSKILDVKPLRSLRPIFSPSNEAPPFVSAPPNGPFPPGHTSFYPFVLPKVPEPVPGVSTPVAPTPLRAYRTPEAQHLSGLSNGGGEEEISAVPSYDGGSSRNPQKKVRMTKNSGFWVAVGEEGKEDVGERFISPISLAHQEDGTRDVVILVLKTFDGIRRRLNQLEDAKEVETGSTRRPDLRAGNILLRKGFRTNSRRRIGPIPGIEIGDIFFFRMELCVVGLHAPSMGGIDYLSSRGSPDEESLALSIVSSGYYEDEAEDTDVLIYSGQGGAITGRKGRSSADQKLERGNLALENSFRRGNEVRVVRGVKDAVQPTLKIYVYDGIYKIEKFWRERAKSGANVFKYKLVRNPGQPAAFSVWKSIEKWKAGLSSPSGLILPDLTSGVESIPVSLVNDVDDERGPASFTYFSNLRYLRSFNFSQSSNICNCSSSCKPGDLDCLCIRKNGGDFPYTVNGVLVGRKPLIHECGPSCKCYPNCKNRASQTGLKVRLEVFKTKDRGWGLRSWDAIRAGTFICHYAGEVIDKGRLKQKLGEGESNEYLFDTSRKYDSFKWNYEPGLLEEDSSQEISEDYDIPSLLIISAKSIGNVARFMNHGCYPNVFWQPVMYSHNDESFLHIAFYAMKHIPPMTELTYDYGTVPEDEDGSDVNNRKKKCLCGSSKCKGYFAL